MSHLTPDTSLETVDLTLTIDRNLVPHFTGELSSLMDPMNWEEDGDMTPDQAAERCAVMLLSVQESQGAGMQEENFDWSPNAGWTGLGNISSQTVEVWRQGSRVEVRFEVVAGMAGSELHCDMPYLQSQSLDFVYDAPMKVAIDGTIQADLGSVVFPYQTNTRQADFYPTQDWNVYWTEDTGIWIRGTLVYYTWEPMNGGVRE